MFWCLFKYWNSSNGNWRNKWTIISQEPPIQGTRIEPARNATTNDSWRVTQEVKWAHWVPAFRNAVTVGTQSLRRWASGYTGWNRRDTYMASWTTVEIPRAGERTSGTPTIVPPSKKTTRGGVMDTRKPICIMRAFFGVLACPQLCLSFVSSVCSSNLSLLFLAICLHM